MRRRQLLERTPTAGIALLAAGDTTPGQAAETGSPAARINAVLQPYLARYGLPALAAAVVRDGRIVAAGAVGTRRADRDIPVRIEDRFHIGSDTKAMTSLLAGMLVEAGRLRWDSTIGEVFPDLVGGMDAGFRAVTLGQLLSHTSGIPSDNEAFGRLLERSFTQDDLNLDELRLWMLREWRARPLESAPSTRFAYSNMGYTLAGAMLERAAGSTWEELVAERVFDPLGLRTAGFGPQASRGRTDAPVGHVLRADGTPKPMLAGPYGDAPAAIGPAGVVHLSILDFAAWAGWHAGGGRRGPPLVRPETLRRLHTPVIDMPPRPDAATGTPRRGSYALGWGIVGMAWSPEPFLAHSGSNTMNLASIMVQPARDVAMVMVTNIGGAKADQALQALAEQLHRQHAPPPRG